MNRPLMIPTAALILALVTAPGSAQTPVHIATTDDTGRIDDSSLLDRPARLHVLNVQLEAALVELTRASGVALAFSPGRLPDRLRVTCQCEDHTVRAALDHLLENTHAKYTEMAGQVVIFPEGRLSPSGPRNGLANTGVRAALSTLPLLRPEIQWGATADSIVAGTVVDSRTRQPVAGAQITVRGTDRGTLTDERGRFRIAGLTGTEATLRIERIGYGTDTRTVPVGDEAIRIALEETVITLDAVVVTGTAFPAKVRSLPNPISVMTARDIEAIGATNITDLLRGEVPGVMALSFGLYDYSSAIFVRGNAGGSSPDLIKIYIDGVEVAQPSFLSTIDPNAIERIEIVRGPQASAIYGSEAASGVMQIFTKKGRPGFDRPRLEVQAATGMVESEFTPGGVSQPLTHHVSLGVTGGTESFSYRAGAGLNTMGEWVKNYESRTLNLSGGLRAIQGPLTLELSALWSDRAYDEAQPPIFLRFPSSPTCPQCGNPNYFLNHDWGLTQSTMGLSFGYRASPRWQHMLTLGSDHNRYGYHQAEPGFQTPADTFVRLSNRDFRRGSARYHTAYELELGGLATARLTGGIDYWRFDERGTFASNLLEAHRTVRTSPATSVILFNDAWWNAGYFGMAEVGLRDRVYLTLAARVEENPNLGEEYGRALSPRAGLAYVREVGPLELKLRGQYGRGVRPPPPVARGGRIVSSTLTYLPNPAIGPQTKVGWDAGFELYWGGRASLALTRFEEEARELIHLVPIDLTSTPRLHQFQNIGVVGIEGWEVEAGFDLGRLAFQTNYTYSNNVIRKVDDATAANPNATLQVGDRTFDAPKYSGGGRLTARAGRGTVSLDASMTKGWRGIDFEAYYGWLYGGDEFRGSLREYYATYPSLWKWNLRAEQSVTDRMRGFIRVENLLSEQAGDLSNLYVTPGRVTVLGVRFTL